MKEDKKLARGVSWAVSPGSPALGSTWKALGVIPAQGREILNGRANSIAAAADDRGFILPQAAARPLLPGCCGRPRRAKPPSLSHAHHCKLLCHLPPSPTPINHGPTARCSFLSWCLCGGFWWPREVRCCCCRVALAMVPASFPTFLCTSHQGSAARAMLSELPCALVCAPPRQS